MERVDLCLKFNDESFKNFQLIHQDDNCFALVVHMCMTLEVKGTIT